MGSKFERDLRGRRFGLLKVVSRNRKKTGGEYWDCRCKCGNTKTVLASNLLTLKTQSCGCLQKQRASEATRTHGESKTRLYGIWKGMRNRCYNPNVRSYKDYGGRGIVVCQEWQEYEGFRKWALENGYDDTLTIERKNCDGNYEPTNCEWIPLPEQGKNTRKNRYIEYDGKRMTLTEWSRYLGGGPNLVTTRLQRGWTEEAAVSTPISKKP